MNQTPNYQLSQWAASDRIQRTDFNADNAKIDAAIKAVEGAIPQIAVGTYTGDGAAERIISLPFTPEAVYICTSYGATFISNVNHTNYFGGLILPDAPLNASNQIYGEIAEGGVRLRHKSENSRTYSTNQDNVMYHYIALSW